jgi:V8-like Glu-specific endopeptidase
MGYENSTDEYIGTGWLLSDDIVVTAGHYLYEWRYKSGFLKYIKCYFDYKGKGSAQS